MLEGGRHRAPVSSSVLEAHCCRGQVWALSPRRASCNTLHLLYGGNRVPLSGSPLLWRHVIPFEHQVPVKTCRPRKEIAVRRHSLSPGCPTLASKTGRHPSIQDRTHCQPTTQDEDERRERNSWGGREWVVGGVWRTVKSSQSTKATQG